MKKYLTPILYTLAFLVIGTFFTSILYYFNITSDKVNQILIYLIAIIAMFVGSIIFAKNNKYKGIISGLLYFVGWFIIMLIMSLLVFKSSFKISSLIYYGVLMIFSVLGGIIGKNYQEENDAE